MAVAAGSIVSIFNPPGNLRDFKTEQQKQGWSDEINGMFESGKAGMTSVKYGSKIYTYTNNAPRPQFFNPLNTAPAGDLTQKVISWVGFPKLVAQKYPTNQARWRAADKSRDVQDEYCEWSVRRAGTKITQVTFTCEGPEYWEYLSQTDPEQVVALYQKYINPDVQSADLFNPSGVYEPRNKWNQDTTNGAMHLIQINNTLGAEVELAAGSSMVRKKGDAILDEQQALIACGRYGNASRNSDPLIGAEVNALSRAGAMVALRDPVGLYFDAFQPTGWTTPDGSDPATYWKIVRGDEDTPVRAVYEVPKEKGFVVGDIKINGELIEFGGQIADFVRVKLVGIAQKIGQTPVTTFGCVTITVQDVGAGTQPLAFMESESSFLPSLRALPKDMREEKE